MNDPRAQGVVLEDFRAALPRLLRGFLAGGGGLVVVGLVFWLAFRNLWVLVSFLVLAALSFGVAVFALSNMRSSARLPWLGLTERGLVFLHKGQEEVLPAAAMEAVGLVTETEVPELVLWFDQTRVPALSQNLQARLREPGEMRLGFVNLGDVRMQTGLSLERVDEVRRFVQHHGIAEWREADSVL